MISPPSIVMNRGIEAMISYLESANQSLNSMSVYIVGYRGEGKSTLRDLLLLPFDDHSDSISSQIKRIYEREYVPTHSVQFYQSKVGDVDGDSILQIYDFADQTEYYTNYELFFKPLSSCYLIVISLFSADGNIKSFDMILKELKHWYSVLKHKLSSSVLRQPNRLHICFTHFDLKSNLRSTNKKFEVLLQSITSNLKKKIPIGDHCQIYFIGKQIDQLENINMLRSSIISNIKTINDGSPIYIPAIYQSIIHQIMTIHSDKLYPKNIISHSQLYHSITSSDPESTITKDDMEGALNLLHNIGDIEIISRSKYYHQSNIKNENSDDNNIIIEDLLIGDLILLYPRSWLVNMINRFVNSDAIHRAINDPQISTTHSIPKISSLYLNDIFKSYWVDQITNQGGSQWEDQYLSAILEYCRMKDICFEVERSAEEELYYFPTAFEHLNPHDLNDYYDYLTAHHPIISTKRFNLLEDDYFKFSFFPSLQVKLCNLEYLLELTLARNASNLNKVVSYSVEIDERWISLQSFSIKQVISKFNNEEKDEQSILLYFNDEKRYLDFYIQCESSLLKRYYQHEKIILSGKLPSSYHDLDSYLYDIDIPLYYKIISLIFTSPLHRNVKRLAICCNNHLRNAVPGCSECCFKLIENSHNFDINEPVEKLLFGVPFETLYSHGSGIIEAANQQRMLESYSNKVCLLTEELGIEKNKRIETKQICEEMNLKLQITSSLLEKEMNDMLLNQKSFFHKFDSNEDLNFLKLLRIIELFRSRSLQPFVEWIAPRHFRELQSYDASVYDVSKIIKSKSISTPPPHFIQNLRIIYSNNEKSPQLMNWKKFTSIGQNPNPDQIVDIQWNQLLVYNLTSMVSLKNKEKLFRPENTDITALLQIVIHIFFPQLCDCPPQFEVKDLKNKNHNNKKRICKQCKMIQKLKDICKKIKEQRNDAYHSTLSASDVMLQQCIDLIHKFNNTIPNIYWRDEKFECGDMNIAECEMIIGIIRNWKKDDFLSNISQIYSDLASFLSDINTEIDNTSILLSE